MTPANITGNNDLAIYQGARWYHTFTFLQTGTTDPVNLTGKTFVIEFRHPSRDTLLFSGVAAFVTDGTDGKITVLATAAQTNTLTKGKVRCGMRDNLNDPYFEGEIPVLPFTPDPA